jgi:hypothetical protein
MRRPRILFIYTGQICELTVTTFALIDNEEVDDEGLIIQVKAPQRASPLLLLSVCSGVRWMRMLWIAADSHTHPAQHINTCPSYGYSGDRGVFSP